jgi:hypothetical protein
LAALWVSGVVFRRVAGGLESWRTMAVIAVAFVAAAVVALRHYLEVTRHAPRGPLDGESPRLSFVEFDPDADLFTVAA